MSDSLKASKVLRTNSLNNSMLGVVTVNDLKDKEYSGAGLSQKEKWALRNYDRYRIEILNKQESEEAFHKMYMELQALANLSPYEEFLKEDYLV